MVPVTWQRLEDQLSLPAPARAEFVDYYGEGDKKKKPKNKSQYQGKRTSTRISNNLSD
jgi:hypothetical protein